MKINNIFLILLLGLVLYFLLSHNSISDILSSRLSNSININHISEKVNNSSNIGFVKPEHRLLKIFDSISSSNKVKPSGTCQRFSFTKHSIDTSIEEYIKKVLQDMIQSLNVITTAEYYLKEIENVYISMNQQNEKRFIVDFFVYDVQNHYSIRLLTDLVVINEELYLNYLNVYAGSNQLLLNKYDVKHNRTGILFDANMFNDNIDHLFDNYYQSNFKLLKPNDDLSSVFQVNTLKNTFFPSSISTKSLEELNQKDLSSYLEMYLPENQNNIKSPIFCNKYSLEWDNKGIFKQKDVDKNDCYFHNEQAVSKINEPYFSPNVITNRSSDDFLMNKGNIISSR